MRRRSTEIDVLLLIVPEFSTDADYFSDVSATAISGSLPSVNWGSVDQIEILYGPLNLSLLTSTNSDFGDTGLIGTLPSELANLSSLKIA